MARAWRKPIAVGAIALGAVMLAGGVAMLLSPDDARRLRCARDGASCVLEAAGAQRVIDLASVERAHVSHARSSGHALHLVTTNGTDILGKRTMSGDSRREYDAAADQINALLAGQVDAIDVTFTYRAGLMPGIAIVLCSLAFVAFGIKSVRA